MGIYSIDLTNLENYDIYAFGENKYGQLVLNKKCIVTPTRLNFPKKKKL